MTQNLTPSAQMIKRENDKKQKMNHDNSACDYLDIRYFYVEI